MIALDQLRSQFRDRVSWEQRRAGVWQVYIPMYHEDGDMVDVYLSQLPDGRVRVSDGGMALMRLSYSLNVHTPSREGILRRIITENRAQLQDGVISVDVGPDELYAGVMQLVQVELKVNNMEYYQRETARSMFYELLDEFIMGSLREYVPLKAYLPITGRDDYEVDYKLTTGSRDVFLFGVKDSAKARLVTISAQEFQLRGIAHRSVAVHEDFGALARKDQSRLMSAVDKQYPSLSDFQEHAINYLQREAA